MNYFTSQNACVFQGFDLHFLWFLISEQNLASRNMVSGLLDGISALDVCQYLDKGFTSGHVTPGKDYQLSTLSYKTSQMYL